LGETPFFLLLPAAGSNILVKISKIIFFLSILYQIERNIDNNHSILLYYTLLPAAAPRHKINHICHKLAAKHGNQGRKSKWL
jgi:hypothetical protein